MTEFISPANQENGFACTVSSRLPERTSPVSQPTKQENLFLNLICNIAIPTVVLIKLSKDEWLGPIWGLVVALAFPVGYFIYDLIVRRKANILSVLGFVSVLLSGMFGLLKMNATWFAVKEATVPLVIGVFVLVTARSKNSLIRELLVNPQVVDVERVNSALDQRNQQPAFEQLLRRASVWIAGSFLVSAILNYALARYILRSPPATPEFNAELGKMNALSWPVIVVPSMLLMMFVFWQLVKGLAAVTGLSSDEIFRAEKKKE